MALEDTTEYHVTLAIWRFVPPVLIIIGTIANVLSVVILHRKTMKSSSTMFYLAILALIDIVVLYSGLLRYWLCFAFGMDIRLVSDLSCKLHGFLVYFSLDFTSWILVAVTVNRCIHVCLPFLAKQYCTLKNAKFVVGFIAISLFIANSHLFWTLGIEDQQCMGLYGFNLAIWPWIDFSIFCLIPFSIMIICNTLIIRQVFGSNNRIDNSLQARADQVTRNAFHVATTSVKKIPSVTAMLLTINCLFLVLTLPIVIYQIGYKYWYPPAINSSKAKMELIWAISNILQYLNNTIHFFLYCLTNPQFRKECVNMVTSKRRANKVCDADNQANDVKF